MKTTFLGGLVILYVAVFAGCHSGRYECLHPVLGNAYSDAAAFCAIATIANTPTTKHVADQADWDFAAYWCLKMEEERRECEKETPLPVYWPTP